MNSYTIFKGAQLLERFSLFERRWFPFYELEQRLAAKAVDALMAQNLGACASILGKGDWASRKVKSVAGKIENHLHLVRRVRLFPAFERMRGRNNVEPIVSAKSLDKLVDQVRFNE